jgi:hypothetical protein
MLIWWSTHNFHTYPTVLQSFEILSWHFEDHFSGAGMQTMPLSLPPPALLGIVYS